MSTSSNLGATSKEPDAEKPLRFAPSSAGAGRQTVVFHTNRGIPLGLDCFHLRNFKILVRSERRAHEQIPPKGSVTTPGTSQ